MKYTVICVDELGDLRMFHVEATNQSEAAVQVMRDQWGTDEDEVEGWEHLVYEGHLQEAK